MQVCGPIYFGKVRGHWRAGFIWHPRALYKTSKAFAERELVCGLLLTSLSGSPDLLAPHGGGGNLTKRVKGVGVPLFRQLQSCHVALIHFPSHFWSGLVLC